MDNLEETDEIDGSYGGPYMVEKILAIYVGKNRKKYYRVKWVDSWEPEDNLSEACQPLIDEFWSSPVHDPTGGEINRTDLKSGQKIIKKEQAKCSSDISKPDSPQESVGPNLIHNTMPTLKYDHDSIQQKEQTEKLKQELVSPTHSRNEGNTIHRQSSQAALISSSVSTVVTETDTNPSSVVSNKSIKRSKSSQCMSPSSSSQSTVIIEKPTRRSVDCQTQTSGNENSQDEILSTLDVNQCLSAVQTTCNVETQNDLTTQTIYRSPLSNVIQQDVDAASELSFSESDIVDLASEEENEVEITLSTPSKRLFVGKQHPASASCLEKRSREKVTQKRRRRKSDGEGTSSVRPPLHPRSLLPMMSSTSKQKTQSPSAPSTQTNFQIPSVQQSGRKRPHNLSTLNTGQIATPDKGNNINKHLTNRTCNICKYTFLNLTQARQHYKQVHVTTSSITNSNRGNQNIVNHPRNNTVNQRSGAQTPDLTCHVCFAFFRNSRDLKSHILLHTEKNLPKCEVCLRTFKNKATLQQHMLIHSDELPHECKTCGKRFRQLGNLISHMGKHTQNNEGVLVCSQCSLEFSDNNDFRNHVRSHESELPYKCSQCHERFNNRGDLMKHLEGHNEGRPFTCPTCKKSFKTKTYLYGHMQMHKVGPSNETRTRPCQSSATATNTRVKTQPPNQ